MFGPKSLLMVALSIVLISVALPAQDNPPPKCCPRSPEPIPTLTEEPAAPQPVQSELIVPRAMLQRQGITPTEFIDRVSEVMLPGRPVSIVMTSQNVINLADQDARPAVAAQDDGLIAVQETRLFQQPRHRLTPEQLDRLNLLWITDGRLYIKVTFVDTVSPLQLMSTQWP